MNKMSPQNATATQIFFIAATFLHAQTGSTHTHLHTHNHIHFDCYTCVDFDKSTLEKALDKQLMAF